MPPSLQNKSLPNKFSTSAGPVENKDRGRQLQRDWSPLLSLLHLLLVQLVLVQLVQLRQNCKAGPAGRLWSSWQLITAIWKLWEKTVADCFPVCLEAGNALLPQLLFSFFVQRPICIYFKRWCCGAPAARQFSCTQRYQCWFTASKVCCTRFQCLCIKLSNCQGFFLIFNTFRTLHCSIGVLALAQNAWQQILEVIACSSSTIMEAINRRRGQIAIQSKSPHCLPRQSITTTWYGSECQSTFHISGSSKTKSVVEFDFKVIVFEMRGNPHTWKLHLSPQLEHRMQDARCKCCFRFDILIWGQLQW